MNDKDIHWLRDALDGDDLEALDMLDTVGDKPGKRLGLERAAMDALAPVTQLIQKHVPNMQPVRLVSFDKSAQTNWTLPWHQDRVIAVEAQYDVPGFGNWSQKAGAWHCEPPQATLNQMLFVRVHLDDSGEDDGAMEIAAGSHSEGIVPSDKAAMIAERYPKHICAAKRGDVLILPMLTLHRSLQAKEPTARRVLRIDYANTALPAPLAWAN